MNQINDDKASPDHVLDTQHSNLDSSVFDEHQFTDTSMARKLTQEDQFLQVPHRDDFKGDLLVPSSQLPQAVIEVK